VSDAVFHAAMLRFVAGKLDETEAADPRTAAMVAVLREAATAFEAGQPLTVAGNRLELAARAFAGFAAFLQKQILPEAVAHNNSIGEAQIRRAVDTAMDAVNVLLSSSALGTGEDVVLPTSQAASSVVD
jgi:nucleoid DNA-binding protein